MYFTIYNTQAAEHVFELASFHVVSKTSVIPFIVMSCAYLSEVDVVKLT